MSEPVELHPGGIVSRHQQQVLFNMDDEIRRQIELAKRSGVPQGMIVALLQAYAHQETGLLLPSRKN